MSKILSKTALKTVIYFGDLMLPKNGDFPSFSETGSVEHIDDLLSYAPKGDIEDLNSALSVIGLLPAFVKRGILNKMEKSHFNNGMLSSTFRELDFGLKGLIYSCYYSGKMGSNYKGKDPQEVIGYEVNRVMD